MSRTTTSLTDSTTGVFPLGGDLPVRRLGFGAMRLTGPDAWGPPRDRAEARSVLRRAVELGVQLIDTADAYGPGINEEQVAAALAPYPADVVIATKGGRLRPERRSWTPDGRPEHLRIACEQSLRRLRVERIDLYQLHVPDPNVPLADSVGALAELREAGKIRHIGLSNVSVEQLHAARRVTEIASVQNRFNLVRRPDEKLLATCERLGIAAMAWQPLAGGDVAAARHELLATVARRYRASPAQVGIAWLLARSPAVLPIPGTSSLRHLEENVIAATLALDQEDIRTL